MYRGPHKVTDYTTWVFKGPNDEEGFCPKDISDISIEETIKCIVVYSEQKKNYVFVLGWELDSNDEYYHENLLNKMEAKFPDEYTIKGGGEVTKEGDKFKIHNFSSCFGAMDPAAALLLAKKIDGVVGFPYEEMTYIDIC